MYKPIIATLGSFVPIQWMMQKDQLPPFLPFYHIVSNEPVPFINSYPIKTEKQFEADLDYFLQYFSPVDLPTLVHHPKKNQMHLSFDDGLKSCFTTVAPILKKRGIPATFFVSQAFADNQNLFHRYKRGWIEHEGFIVQGKKKYFYHETDQLDQPAADHGLSWQHWLAEHQPYMSTSEIRSLQTDGFTIGAHSIDHPEFWLLNEEEQFTQVSESMSWVVRNFDPSIRAFAFPFTDDGVKLSLFQRLREADVTDITFGTAGLKHDLADHHFQRIPIERRCNWSARKVVHFEFFYYFVRSIVNRNRVIRSR